MHQVADVEVAKNIMDANKKLADKNLKNLEEKDIFCVDFVGAIGSGKTTLVEEIIDKPSTRIGAFNKFHIWTRDHVKGYLGRNNAKIWILRVYKLDKPQMLKRTRGMKFANVDKSVKLEGKPVISDDDFDKLKKEILNTH